MRERVSVQSVQEVLIKHRVIDMLENSHALSVAQVLKKLKVNANVGLSEEEVVKRRAIYGPNGICSLCIDSCH